MDLIWHFYKFVLHAVTKKSRIERLCSASGFALKPSAQLIRAVELEILASKHTMMQGVAETIQSLRPFDVSVALQQVTACKRIVDSEVVKVLRSCLSTISDYNSVVEELRALKQPYSKGNPDHEAALEELWQQLRPGVRRNGGRITKEWQEIGFQGSDPATDMRGMGFLGLSQLLNFTQTHKEVALKVYMDSVSFDYPMAISGINFSLDIFNWVTSRQAAVVLYAAQGGPSLYAVNDLYAQLFCVFNEAWVKAKPPNMLAFEGLRKTVTKQCEKKLAAGQLLHALQGSAAAKPRGLHLSGLRSSGARSQPSPSSPSGLL